MTWQSQEQEELKLCPRKRSSADQVLPFEWIVFTSSNVGQAVATHYADFPVNMQATGQSDMTLRALSNSTPLLSATTGKEASQKLPDVYTSLCNQISACHSLTLS
jgi:hypothetical protein